MKSMWKRVKNKVKPAKTQEPEILSNPIEQNKLLEALVRTPGYIWNENVQYFVSLNGKPNQQIKSEFTIVKRVSGKALREVLETIPLEMWQDFLNAITDNNPEDFLKKWGASLQTFPEYTKWVNFIKSILEDDACWTRYDIFQQNDCLGSGAQGKVYRVKYLARYNENGKLCVKALSAERTRVIKKCELQSELDYFTKWASNPSTLLERTIREYILAIRMQIYNPSDDSGLHPQLPILDDKRSFSWMSMRLVGDRDLSSLLGNAETLKALDHKTRLLIAVKLAETVEKCRRAGIVHRDIKPENIRIKINDNGIQIWLIDFGMARQSYAPDGRRPGTPVYMAPEVFYDKTVTPNEQTDNYALGRIFSLLYGIEQKSFITKEIKVVIKPNLNTLFTLFMDKQVSKADNPLDQTEIPVLRTVIKGLLQQDPKNRMRAAEAFEKLDRLYRRHYLKEKQTTVTPRSDKTSEAGPSPRDLTFFRNVETPRHTPRNDLRSTPRSGLLHAYSPSPDKQANSARSSSAETVYDSCEEGPSNWWEQRKSPVQFTRSLPDSGKILRPKAVRPGNNAANPPPTMQLKTG